MTINTNNTNTMKAPKDFTGGTVAYSTWNNRGRDRKFSTAANLTEEAEKLAASTKTALLDVEDVARRLATSGREVVLRGNQALAPFTHWGFNQLSGLSKSPAGFLRKLSPDLTASILRERLGQRDGKVQCVVRGEQPTIAAMLSETYYREPTAKFFRNLFETHAVEDRGWRYTAGFVSDRNAFAFLVADDIGGENGRFRRGLILTDSDVGERARSIMSFTFDFMCMNSLIGIRGMELSMRLRHTSEKNLARFDKALDAELDRIERLGFDDELKAIEAARRTVLGKDKAEAVEVATRKAKSKGLVSLTESRIARAVDLAERFTDRYGDPRTAWAVVGGLTQDSQTTSNTDDRMTVDVEAGRLMRTLVAA